MALLALDVLGFPLAWDKGICSDDVVWIGARIRAAPQGIEIAIPEGKLAELLECICGYRKSAVATRRSLRSYCGKLSFVAGMVPTLRPFLGMVWAALSSRSKLPSSLVHCRQFRVALDWLLALLRQVRGPLVRVFPFVEHWAPVGDYLATDACPWGFAGVLFKDFQPVGWFATPLTPADLRRFRAKRGESCHNTTWEALAILVAARIWLPGSRLLARVKSDSLSAIRSVVKLASRSPALNLIARELALDSVLGLYTVGVAEHIPGIANVLPDDLSRLWALRSRRKRTTSTLTLVLFYNSSGFA